MSSISVRKLLSNGDPSYGNGQADFIYDKFAVAQLIYTRLELFTGEFWNNLQDGLPMFQSILGVGGAEISDVAAQIIIDRIISTPFVNNVQKVVTSYTVNTRTFKFQCDAVSDFGVISINVGPASVSIITR